MSEDQVQPLADGALPSTFERTGRTWTDGTYVYREFRQLDAEGNEISIAQDVCEYCRDLTRDVLVSLDNETTLSFRVTHPVGEYEFETKLLTGEVYRGVLTQDEYEEDSFYSYIVGVGRSAREVTDLTMEKLKDAINRNLIEHPQILVYKSTESLAQVSREATGGQLAMHVTVFEDASEEDREELEALEGNIITGLGICRC